jgi:hypothetical protein
MKKMLKILLNFLYIRILYQLIIYIYINDEELIEVSFLSYGQEVELKVDN